MFIRKIILVTILIAFLSGCGAATSSTENSDTFSVHTTVYPIQYIVERLGGSSLEVHSVYPPGTNAHTYEPTAKEMTEIAEGNAFIYLGGNMEAFAETTAAALAEEDTKQIELSQHESLFAEAETEESHVHEETAEPHEEESHEGHNHADHDSHIWLDPVRMAELTSILEQELIALLPEEEAKIQERAQILKEELAALHEEFAETIAAKEKKEILVSHAAYGYWEQRYGIEQLAINGVSSESEPSQQELIQIIETAKEHNMDYVIFEQNISNSVSEKIQEEIGAESLAFHNLAVLTEEDIENGEDYFSLMDQNLDVLKKALTPTDEEE